MARHLKTHIISRLEGAISYFVPNSDVAATHARGVRYYVPAEAFKGFWGKMNTVKEGCKYRKHIIVRTLHRNRAVLQLYTYHYPRTWSAACVANRELIKLAQRQAHALEHDYSQTGIEWRIRFFEHYFRVFKGGAKPAPGLKPYSRFYQFVYVSIYRELKSAVQQAQQTAAADSLPPTADDVSFAPIRDVAFDPIQNITYGSINPRPLRSRRSYPLQHACNTRHYADNLPSAIPQWQDFHKIVT